VVHWPKTTTSTENLVAIDAFIDHVTNGIHRTDLTG
jgi:hypothetical protein